MKRSTTAITLVHQRRQQGLVVVELAIVTALLLLLLMFTAEFSRLFYQYNELNKALRPAIRYLSENARSSAGAPELLAADIAIAKNLLVFGSPQNTGQPRFNGLTTDAVLVSSNSTYVSIDVAWTYQTLFGGSLPAFQFAGNTIDTSSLVLKASISMRALN